MPALVDVDDPFDVLELLDRRKKPVRLDMPEPLLLTPPGKTPPPLWDFWDCCPEVWRVGYNLLKPEAEIKNALLTFIKRPEKKTNMQQIRTTRL